MTRYTPQWLQAGTYAASQDRRLIGALWPAPASAGCAVTASSGMVVNVAAGQVAVPSGNNTGTVLCSSDAVEAVTVGAAPVGNNRIDLVVCQARGNDLDGGANNDFLFTTVAGTAATTPVAPAVPANAVALAQIYVGSGVAAINQGNITDVRPGGLSMDRGLVGANQNSGTVTAGTSLTNIATVTAVLTAGRNYRANAFGFLVQQTATGQPQFQLGGGSLFTTQTFALTPTTVAVGQFLAGTAVQVFTPAATGSASVTLGAQTSAGTAVINPGNGRLWLEDIGGT